MSQAAPSSAYAGDELVTGEGVSVELPVATVLSRAVSCVIDIAVSVFTLFVVLIVWAWLAPNVSDAVISTLVLLTLVGALVVLPMTVETLSRGKSLGKLIMGLRTVRDDGGPITSRHALARALVGFVEFYVFSGAPALIAGIASSRSKRLGDMTAGTYVVSERTRLVLPAAPAMPPPLAAWAYAADIASLPPKLTVAVRQFLGRAGGLDPAARASLGRHLLDSTLAYVSPAPPTGFHPEFVLAAILADRRRRDLDRLGREDALRASVLPVDEFAAPPPPWR
ncbi:MAG: RDD family protein [Phycicoccus sp.]|nr:RDD family protein [Phycicoccus sp.]